jgi:hypothetical protein
VVQSGVQFLGPALLLAAGYSIAPFVHGSFYYVAEMPEPLSRWLKGAGLNLGMLFFFTLSLVFLWNEREPEVFAVSGQVRG